MFEVNAIRTRTQTAILIFSIAYNLLAVGLASEWTMGALAWDSRHAPFNHSHPAQRRSCRPGW